MKKFLTILLAFSMALAANAQVADSTFLKKQPLFPDFKAKQLIVPGSLMAAGVLTRTLLHEPIDVKFNNQTSKWRGDNRATNVDDYLRFVPYVMNLGYEYIGGDPRHGILDRTFETAWAFGSAAALCFGIKSFVKSARPDGSNEHSFPSGHACFAFSGAELVRMEYGWGCGASAYIVAGTVCFFRLYNNKHWFSDLVFGAGLGVLSAHIGEWMIEPTRRVLGIKQKSDVAFTATIDPISGAVCPTLAMTF